MRHEHAVMSALGWRWAERLRPLALEEGTRIDLAYRLRRNEHPDFGGLELRSSTCGLLLEISRTRELRNAL